MPIFDEAFNSRLQTLDPEWVDEREQRDAQGLYPKTRIISEVSPHPIRRNRDQGRPDYFEGLTYTFLVNLPKFPGLDIMGDGSPVLTMTAPVRTRDLHDLHACDRLLFVGDPSGEDWHPPHRVPLSRCAPMAVPALGPDTLILRGYRGDDDSHTHSLCRSDDRGKTWGECSAVGHLPDGRELYTDLAYQPLVEGTEMTFGFYVEGSTQPETEPMGGQSLLRTYHADTETWDEPRLLPKAWRTSESSVVRAKNGDLVACLRTHLVDIPSPHDGWRAISTTWSSDNGETWAEPQAFFRFGRVHANITVVPDGRLIMTHAARIGELDGRIYRGYEAVVSTDHGRTWDWLNRYIIYRSNDPSMHSPRTVVLNDGRLLTCFMHHITCSWTDLPERLPHYWTSEIGLSPEQRPMISNPNAGANFIGLGQISAVIWNLEE